MSLVYQIMRRAADAIGKSDIKAARVAHNATGRVWDDQHSAMTYAD